MARRPVNDAAAAADLAENSLLARLLEAREKQIYERWQSEQSRESREQLHAESHALKELRSWIYGECKRIAAGQTPSADAEE